MGNRERKRSVPFLYDPYSSGFQGEIVPKYYESGIEPFKISEQLSEISRILGNKNRSIGRAKERLSGNVRRTPKRKKNRIARSSATPANGRYGSGANGAENLQDAGSQDSSNLGESL